jgi:hypothetical protein
MSCVLVKVSPHPDPFLPDVFNLGFGPPGGPNDFQDNVRIRHADVGKVFSTVLFHGLIFLQSNPGLRIISRAK